MKSLLHKSSPLILTVSLILVLGCSETPSRPIEKKYENVEAKTPVNIDSIMHSENVFYLPGLTTHDSLSSSIDKKINSVKTTRSGGGIDENIEDEYVEDDDDELDGRIN